jgi:signal transduction histidine kinase
VACKCYNYVRMNRSPGSNIRTGSNADIAFAIVVLTSYFATFSSIRQADFADVLLIIFLGITYVMLGIYGYSYAARSEKSILRKLYFVIQLPLGCLIIALGRGAGFSALLLLPLGGQAVVLLTDYWAYITNLGIVAAYVIAVKTFTVNWADVWSNLPIFLAGLVFIVVFTQVAVGEEKARKEVERLLTELQETNQRLREYSLKAEELAVMKERNRLAREIHDGLGHYLTTVNMEIQAAIATLSKKPNRAIELLVKASTLSQEALSDVRNSVATLRAPMDENFPLGAIISEVVKSCECSGIETNFLVLGNERPVSPAVRFALFRTIQESVSNVQRHAHASNLWVTLDYRQPQHTLLTIKDDGVGSENADGGFGLLGMRERARLVNGVLQVSTSPGEGFVIQLMVPE